MGIVTLYGYFFGEFCPIGGMDFEAANDILHGITRAAVLRFANEAQMKVEERMFTIEEAKQADEAFVTSATTFVMPVVAIDDAQIGSGAPGPVAKRLREIYLEESLNAAV